MSTCPIGGPFAPWTAQFFLEIRQDSCEKIACQRPLESIYIVVFLDAIHFHVRSEGQIVKKAVYIAIGVNLDGRKDILGM